MEAEIVGVLVLLWSMVGCGVIGFAIGRMRELQWWGKVMDEVIDRSVHAGSIVVDVLKGRTHGFWS